MTQIIDHMSPDASPAAPSTKTGVRRVNNIPMYLVGGALALFLIVMALVAMDRARKQNAPAPDQKAKAGNTAMFAKEIAGDQTGGIVEPSKPPVVPVPIAKPENLDVPPAPPGAGHAKGSVEDEEANRIRLAKLQMFEEAVKAKTSVPFVAPRSAGSSPVGSAGAPQSRGDVMARLAAVREQIDKQREEDPTAAYKARLAQVRSMGLGGEGDEPAPGLLHTAAADTARNGISQFGNTAGGDRWKLDSKAEPPRSPYELRAGFVLPATLISGINAELPGQIVAQVAQDVYDTATGKYLLIPQGTRLVGAYSSDVVYGQARVLVAWQRVVFPDGKAMDIGAMPGSDSAGYAGFTDQVNNHYFRLFASALLMSGVTAGITYNQRQNQAGNIFGAPSASSALSEAVGQQLGQVTAQLIAKNMGIAPTLEIRPGYRFNVVVTKDMTFSKPYQAFDY